MSGADEGGELRQSWRTVVGCMMAASIGTIGLFAYTNGVFVPELIAEAGFTRAQLSLATFVLSAAVAVLAPFAGAAMDRFGPMRVIGVAILGEAIAFCAFAALPSDFTFYIAAILALALLGVGTTPPGFSRIITERFERSRGLALGIAISGLGLMAIFGPIVFNWVLEQSNWRFGYLVVAMTVLTLGGCGLALIASDHRGRAHGARRDAARGTLPRAGSWSSLRQPLFWVLLVGFLLPALFSAGYLFHMVSLLRDRGFSSGDAAQVQSLIGVAILAGRLGSGAAMDRFPAPYVAAIAFTVSAVGCVALLSSSPVMIAIAALGIGLTIGAELDIMAYTIARYFGVENFGKLYGLAYGGLIICGGFSPMLITLIADAQGYSAALIVSAIGTFAGAVVLALIPRGLKRQRSVIGEPLANGNR